MTISCTFVQAAKAARQVHLSNDYSCICSCVACRLDMKNAEASDNRHVKINDLIEEITPGGGNLRTSR